MAKRVTQTDIDEWIRLYVEEGLSCRDIAKRCGWGKTTVNKHLETSGVLRKKSFATEEMVDAWVEAYTAGVSPYELSKKYGFNDETIRMHLKKRGVEMHPVGGPLQHDHANDAEWQSLYLSGACIREIAEQYGASETTVSVRLRQMGTPMRKGWETNQQVTESIADKWVELYEGGMSSVQIAEEYDFTSTTVLEYLHRAGVDTGPIITNEDAVEIKRRYEAGDTVQALSLEYGVTDTYIRVKLKEQGAEIREPVRGFVFSEEEIADWCRRYDSGESISSIAFSAGIKSPDAVRKRLAENGVEIRDKVSSTASSWPEWAIYYYMQKAFPGCDIGNNVGVSTEKGTRYPDVTVASDDGSIRIAIEYDGAFWHDNKAKRKSDAEKTSLLAREGYTVFRIIEDADGEQGQDSFFEIHCSQDRDSVAEAIETLLDRLSIDGVLVDLGEDAPAISELYYQAKNRTAHGLEWAELYNQGYSTNRIAEMYGVTPTTVSTSLKLQGIEIRHRPTDDLEKAAWLSMFNDGMSVPSIANARGVDKSVIYRYLKSQGITFEKHPRKPITELDLEWKHLYLEEGRSLSFIARKYRVSPTTVSKHLSKMGVEVRKSSHRKND